MAFIGIGISLEYRRVQSTIHSFSSEILGSEYLYNVGTVCSEDKQLPKNLLLQRHISPHAIVSPSLPISVSAALRLGKIDNETYNGTYDVCLCTRTTDKPHVLQPAVLVILLFSYSIVTIYQLTPIPPCLYQR